LISFSFSFKTFISSFYFNIFSIFSFLISHIFYFIIWHFQFMFIDNQKCWRWCRRKWNWSLRSTNTKFVYARKWPCTFRISLYMTVFYRITWGHIRIVYLCDRMQSNKIIYGEKRSKTETAYNLRVRRQYPGQSRQVGFRRNSDQNLVARIVCPGYGKLMDKYSRQQSNHVYFL